MVRLWFIKVDKNRFSKHSVTTKRTPISFVLEFGGIQRSTHVLPPRNQIILRSL